MVYARKGVCIVKFTCIISPLITSCFLSHVIGIGFEEHGKETSLHEEYPAVSFVIDCVLPIPYTCSMWKINLSLGEKPNEICISARRDASERGALMI